VRVKPYTEQAALYCTKQTVPMSSAVALSAPSIDSRLLAGSSTSCSSEAHICGVMSLPCKWQRRSVLVCASDSDLDGLRLCGEEGRFFGNAPRRRRSHSTERSPLPFVGQALGGASGLFGGRPHGLLRAKAAFGHAPYSARADKSVK
jgi:hypothetical protein